LRVPGGDSDFTQGGVKGGKGRYGEKRKMELTNRRMGESQEKTAETRGNGRSPTAGKMQTGGGEEKNWDPNWERKMIRRGRSAKEERSSGGCSIHGKGEFKDEGERG